MFRRFAQSLGFGDEEDYVVGEYENFEKMSDGEMREVTLGETNTKVLIIKQGSELFGLSNKCTHYGAPLIKGAVGNGHIRCPWHGACFDIATGDIEDFPGLSSLYKFKTSLVDGQLVVTAPKCALSGYKRDFPPCKKLSSPQQTVLIIGGGACGQTCAETLRRHKYNGRIIIATAEPCLPYDRPKLSKALNSTAAALALRNSQFYTENCIEVLVNHKAVGVDVKQRLVRFEGKSDISYDKLLLATGGSPRVLDKPGSSLTNIFLLRTPTDGQGISKAAQKKNVVILGNSFIGIEVAAALVGKAASVTVIGRDPIPFRSVLGEDIGKALLELHKTKGVAFVSGTSIGKFEPSKSDPNSLGSVLLADGSTLPADLCILGIGVTPSTSFLKDSTIKLSATGHVIVNKFLESSVENVFAGGDITRFPLICQYRNEDDVSIGHWQLAQAHGLFPGRTIALNMLGKQTEFHSVPYFWTQQYGKSLRYCGYGAGWDSLVTRGSVADLDFVTYFCKNDQVIAVASMNRDPVVSETAEILSKEKIPKSAIFK